MTRFIIRSSVAAVACALVSNSVLAEDATLTNPAISAILDGYYQNTERPMAERSEGFGLGHTELALSANIDDMFYGKLTTVVETNDGETEIGLEEAFIQTLSMPAGFSVRAGRFLSDVGYMNNQHVHVDAFTDRPAAYRAFLGSHYFDDGLRLAYVAPTDLYWTLGVEAFKGDSMRAEDEVGDREFKNLGVYTAFTKFGGDIGVSSSWMMGLSYLRNENGRLSEPLSSGTAAVDDHDHDHDHSHGAMYTGENTYIADFVYKWAPNGNYKYQHLTLSGEFFRVTDYAPAEDHAATHAHDDAPGDHTGWYVSSVYQFTPNWSAGLRYGQLDTHELHDDHFDAQKLKETEVSLAWHNSHFSTVRLQYTHQDGTNFDGIEDDHVITLQYVMALGAHGAHQF
ncbi:OprO/OprP family phosphate-selective porin [Shewanella sp. Isolate11]|uniref:OprO/OprP family phosphate-selective porin n=1 Tax=Shewanella sp. Isolate11 TaxID=2908530 RepID=UPI001EFE53C0|nr:OprO/OprP family phosphate-selective porin [Shewanella sp. Isolate11]MCG9695530.1 OprO/OprP family phosphate-selective porin [Shewanella sp. Isolate11]